MFDELLDIVARLLILAALIFANGFFVATEFAFVSVRRTRIEELVAQGSRTAKAVHKAINELDRYIAGTQVGITLASLILGWVSEPALAALITPLLVWLPLGVSKILAHSIAVIISFAIITMLHVVLGELVPKSLALQKPEETALVVARPMQWAMFVFRPFIWSLNGIGNFLLRRLHLEAAGETHNVHSVEELQILVRQSHDAGVLDDLEQQMLQRTFRFGGLTAGEVMVPRLDMVAFDVKIPPNELLDRVSRNIHTRIPIYEGSIDNIIGILQLRDLFRHLRRQGEELNVRQMLRPPLVVPRGIRLDTLLEKFRQHHTQIAIVVDEQGGTEGMATLKDVVEEIFGEVKENTETDRLALHCLPDGRTLVRGDVRLHRLAENTGWVLPDDRADTIGGYVMACLGRTAVVGDIVKTRYGIIRVENMTRMRITQVSLNKDLQK
jgi:CBS domain containing-hemolysin-like protein